MVRASVQQKSVLSPVHTGKGQLPLNSGSQVPFETNWASHRSSGGGSCSAKVAVAALA